MNFQDVARWVTWSRRRLVGATTIAATVASIAGMVVLVGRVGGWGEATDDFGVQPIPTTAPGYTAVSPSYVPPSIETPTPDSKTLEIFEDDAAATAAGLFLRAWLDGEQDEMEVLAHPAMLVRLEPPEPGLYLTGPPFLVDGFGGPDLASVKATTSAGTVMLTVIRTDEVGWIVRDMAGP